MFKKWILTAAAGAALTGAVFGVNYLFLESVETAALVTAGLAGLAVFAKGLDAFLTRVNLLTPATESVSQSIEDTPKAQPTAGSRYEVVLR